MTEQEPEIRIVDAPVEVNRDVGAGYRLLTLVESPAARAAVAGQFLTLSFPGRTDPLLPRPFAIYNAMRGIGRIEVLFKIVGRGTRLLAGAREGDMLRLVAPLGRGWRPGDEDVSVLVAGGTAWAALHLLAWDLHANGRDIRPVWGEPREAAFPDLEVVAAPGVPFVLASDDGSCGRRGTAVDCARALVTEELHGRRAALYGAGPEPMLRALAALADDLGLSCQVSLEARMACGIGVCRGCVVNATSPHPETGLRRRAVCVDGPVFDAREIDWGDLA